MAVVVGPVLKVVHSSGMEDLHGENTGSPTTPRCYQDCMVLNVLTRNVGDWQSNSTLKEALSVLMVLEVVVLPYMTLSETALVNGQLNDLVAAAVVEEERNSDHY